MSGAYEIEMAEPSLSRCECCGGLTVRLTRYVERDGEAFAIYYAMYANNHADNELAMLVSLGEWGEESEPSQRAAFYCRVRPTEESYEVMLDDAAGSAWRDAEIVGTKLSREEALFHPWKATAFEVLDEAFVQDPSLRGFLQRTQCEDAAAPLEYSFRAPDDIFALDNSSRAELGRSFASLDDARFFVRCLLPLPVTGYGSWCVGFWIEVTRSDFRHVREVWDDPERYPGLRFSGAAANDLATELDLPIPRGMPLQLHVPDPSTPPMVEAPPHGALADLLTRQWPQDDFEQYAVARGFL